VLLILHAILHRRLGFNVLVSGLAVPVIHGTFAYWSGPSWIPDPRFIIHVSRQLQ
jgi:hypothetical protein